MQLELSTLFSPAMHLFLTQVGQAAHDWGARAYLVGGMPRDLIRGQTSVDLDLVLEGDAIAFSRELKSQWNALFKELPAPAKQLAFKRYGTAKLLFSPELFPGVQSIDFASARTEQYPTPGGAPVVQPSDLQADLARRDFSINAIAVELSPIAPGAVHDPHQGVKHLGENRIAVLHPRSFIDDPARLIRAVRFSTRLGYQLDDSTATLFKSGVAAQLIRTLPPARCEDEFRKAMEEPRVTPVMLELSNSGLLTQILPGLRLTDQLIEKLSALDLKRQELKRQGQLVTALEYLKLLHDFSTPR